MKKVIVLTSGGLDSTLAVEIMKREGLEVIGLHCYSWFTLQKFKDFQSFPAQDTKGDVPLVHIDVSPEHTDAILHPHFGYGNSVNPCIDCKLLFFLKARELMESQGADFVATGEVLGQRPMTQRPDVMRMLEKKSGLAGILLRPLSARLLPPTIPEREGWLQRKNMFDISGRGRKRQMALAKQFGIEEYPSPAGGCRVTEKNFKVRFDDLVSHTDNVGIFDLVILKYGRHFRISDSCKLVVGKNQQENEFLENLTWGNVALTVVQPVGPFSLMRWDQSQTSLSTAIEIIARYCIHKSVDGRVLFKLMFGREEEEREYRGIPDTARIEALIIR